MTVADKKPPFLDPKKYKKSLVLGVTKCSAKKTCGKDIAVRVSVSGLAYAICNHCGDDLEPCYARAYFGKAETLAWAKVYDASLAKSDGVKNEPTTPAAERNDNGIGFPDL